MKATVSILLLSPMSVACASISASDEDRTLSFGCGDVVLIGRVANLDYQSVDIEDDIIGYGWITANLSVRRVVKGPRLPSSLPVKYFAHTYMREDRDFMFVLSKTEANEYRIETGQLMSLRPRLAAQCDQEVALSGL
jgi:hypothetical protein